METIKIKTKIGDNEFEGEGPEASITAQFEAFLNRISVEPAKQPAYNTNGETQAASTQVDTVGSKHVSLETIMHVSGRIVSLTALPQSNEEAALLIMLGHKDLRNNQAVTGQEIGDGLAQSGRPVPRVDRIMDKAIAEALVLKNGFRRSTRYRLTNSGLVKALNIAKSIVESLP
jgi:hypothetical protein